MAVQRPSTQRRHKSHLVGIGTRAGHAVSLPRAFARCQWQRAHLSDATFTTVGDTVPPVISAVAAAPAVQGATITWTTDEASTSQVDYGLTTAYGSTTALDSAQVTSHTVTLSGLTSNTLYHYRVRSRDASGNERISSDATFITTGDTVPPVISNVAAPPGDRRDEGGMAGDALGCRCVVA